MTLSPTSLPAFPTCWCTRTWPCGPVHLRGHSCLITPLQSSSQKHRPSTHISGHKDKMSHTLNSCQQTHHHPPHNPRNLPVLHSLCRSLTQHLLNQCPLHHHLSLYPHICQFRQCSQQRQHCPHRLTYTVKQWTPHLPQNPIQISSDKESPVSLRYTLCQIPLHWTMNQCELDQSQVDPAQTGALPSRVGTKWDSVVAPWAGEDQACSAWDPLPGATAAPWVKCLLLTWVKMFPNRPVHKSVSASRKSDSQEGVVGHSLVAGLSKEIFLFYFITACPKTCLSQKYLASIVGNMSGCCWTLG